jgi:hypothetical protein
MQIPSRDERLSILAEPFVLVNRMDAVKDFTAGELYKESCCTRILPDVQLSTRTRVQRRSCEKP